MDRYLPSGLKPKKRFGQNFLVDARVVADLVATANLKRSDVVVEVGAGTGVLTKELAKKAGKVIAFEIDRDLISLLKKELAGFSNVETINKDFLKVRPQQLNHLTVQPFKLVGSIPYQITSPLIHKLLTFKPRPSLVVLLIQKEVAEKITAKPPKATYLSNIVKLLGEAEIVRFISKTAFWPVPEVDGAIIKLKVQNLKFKIDVENFQKFLHKGFQNPRKMLRNKFDPEVLKKVGIDPTQRAQELTLARWIHLFCELIS